MRYQQSFYVLYRRKSHLPKIILYGEIEGEDRSHSAPFSNPHQKQKYRDHLNNILLVCNTPFSQLRELSKDRKKRRALVTKRFKISSNDDTTMSRKKNANVGMTPKINQHRGNN